MSVPKKGEIPSFRGFKQIAKSKMEFEAKWRESMGVKFNKGQMKSTKWLKEMK